MFNMISKLIHFARAERGAASLEVIILLPLLAFAYMGMFATFDALRQQNSNIKAAYSVSDVLSRQTNPVDQAYLDGLGVTLNYLTQSSEDVGLRTTVVYWDNVLEEHVMVWSRSANGASVHTQASVDTDVVPRLPPLAHAETVIVLETFSLYEPPANLAVDPTFFRNFVVTSPRFAQQLCWEACGAIGVATVHDDGFEEGDGA